MEMLQHKKDPLRGNCRYHYGRKGEQEVQETTVNPKKQRHGEEINQMNSFFASAESPSRRRRMARQHLAKYGQIVQRNVPSGEFQPKRDMTVG